MMMVFNTSSPPNPTRRTALRVFVTPRTSRDFELAAATLRDAGHTVSCSARGEGGFLSAVEQDMRTLFGSDFVVTLTGWRDCPESVTDILTADGAGIAWGDLEDALADA